MALPETTVCRQSAKLGWILPGRTIKVKRLRVVNFTPFPAPFFLGTDDGVGPVENTAPLFVGVARPGENIYVADRANLERPGDFAQDGIQFNSGLACWCPNLLWGDVFFNLQEFNEIAV